jgi:hypothetical protein
MVVLYNQHGLAVAYLHDDDKHLYLFDGTPAGYVRNDFIYGYNGRYLGWIFRGWYYDRSGHPGFFTVGASGGPGRPARGVTPVRGVRQVRPVKQVRQVRPVRPARSLAWSAYNGRDFFEQ